MVAGPERILYSGAFGTRDDSSRIKTAPDSLFAIASMTKAVTSVAAMQLVERGKLNLDQPVGNYLPELARVEVLEGFDSAGKPRLRAAAGPVTLRHLLSHSSGFAYDTWNENMSRYAAYIGPPSSGTAPGYPSSLWGRAPLPLMFDPGTGWQYGPSADWTARIVETVSGQKLDRYFQSNIFDPLRMKDTGYVVDSGKFERLVSTWDRQSEGSLKQLPRRQPAAPTTFFGGTGLFSTAGDYTRFMQMILRRGQAPGGESILQAKTVQAMSTNQIGSLSAGKCRNFAPGSGWHDVTFHPGYIDGFGLGFLINSVAYPGGRSAGSLAWAGGWNTYYWIDPARAMCAVVMMQFQPFYDSDAVAVLSDFEKAVYRAFPAKA
jgi:methyl acetate hydrolase